MTTCPDGSSVSISRRSSPGNAAVPQRSATTYGSGPRTGRALLSAGAVVAVLAA